MPGIKLLRREGHKNRHQYKVNGCPVLFVDSSEKIEQVQRMLKDSTRVGLDTEATGFNIRKDHPYGVARMVSMQFTCAGPKLKGVNDANFIFVPNWGKYKGTYRHFRKFLEDDTPKKVLHNFKFDAHVIENHGIRMRGLKSDTIAKAVIRDVSEDHGLKELAKRYLGFDSPDFGDVFRLQKLKKNGDEGKMTYTPQLEDVVNGSLDSRYPEGGIRRLVEYAVKDPYYTIKLDTWLDKKLSEMEWYRDKSMLDYYKTFDNEYLEVLFRMERLGCHLNLDFLQETHDMAWDEVVELEKEFYHQAVKLGADTRELETLNMGSNPQVGKLFESLGMKLTRTNPTKNFPNGQPQVSDSALQTILKPRYRPIINTLLDWRSLSEKLLGTYVIPWMKKVKSTTHDDILRTEYRFPGPVTGRLASAKPNLQNIPRPMEEGSEEGDKHRIRRAFVAPQGMLFGDADLEQIELRVIAHVSGDEEMIKAFHQGWDLHARTAIFCFQEVGQFVKGRPMSKDLLKEVKENFKTQRQSAKTLGFMIAYGGGPRKYAAKRNTTLEEGARVIESLFRGYPGLKRAIDRERAKARKNGYVRTMLGRYIHIPDINHQDFGRRAGAERQAFNYVIQGSAAEHLKMTMILIHKDPRLQEMDVTMRLQVHDELCFYVPKEYAKKAKPIIDDYMSNPYKHFGLKALRVPTPGELGYGPTWMDAKSA